MNTPNLADLRARLSAAQARAAQSAPRQAWPLITRLDGAPTPGLLT